MSSDSTPPSDIREPRPLRLLLIGLVIVAGASAIVLNGVKGRARGDQEVARRTVEQALPSVEVISPRRGADAQALVLPGDIQAFALAPIYARASGYVRSWFKDIGDTVKKGERLAEIDTPDLDQQYAQAKADVATAKANAALAVSTAARYRELVGRSIVSKQSDDEKAGDAAAKQAIYESSQANLARIEALMAFKVLVAPFDGIVTTRSIDIGALINAGGTTGLALYQVADIRRMRVYVRVPQAFSGDLKDGMTATLRMPQYPGKTFQATLVGISRSISQESRTALVQLQAENPEGKLWPGTYTEVTFQIPANPDALRLPATSLLFGERGVRVATVDGTETVTIKPVLIGRDIGSDVEILAGLAASDRVIDTPLETLGDGDKVRIVRTTSPSPAKVVAAEGTKQTN